MRLLRRVLGTAFTIALISPSITAAENVAGVQGREVLKRTFDNLYDCDLKMLLEVELHDMQGGVSTRRAKIARKRIRGHTHSIGRFLDPPWMRGTTMLMIDNSDRSDDRFIYLPESKRTRRLTSVQRSDAFLGSDLWYEDLDRRYPEDYEVISVSTHEEAASRSLVVRVRPVRNSSAYDEIEFEISKSDYFLLRTSYYRGKSSTPIREITSTREYVLEQQGHRIPTRYEVRNDLRGTKTIATFTRMEINPKLKDSLFRMVALQVGRKIPGLDGDANTEGGNVRERCPKIRYGNPLLDESGAVAEEQECEG